MHCLRPASACVEQLLACALQEIVDRVLGDALLEMSIDSAEGELLSRVVAGLPEGVVLKAPVVAVVVEDLHAVFSGECFEGAFGGDGLLG